MTKLPTLIVIGMASLLPWQAMAADAPAPAAKQKPYWETFDANHDGNIDKKEWMTRAEEQFKEYDANGDGLISKDELKAHSEKMRAHFEEMREQHQHMPMAPAPAASKTSVPVPDKK